MSWEKGKEEKRHHLDLGLSGSQSHGLARPAGLHLPGQGWAQRMQQALWAQTQSSGTRAWVRKGLCWVHLPDAPRLAKKALFLQLVLIPRSLNKVFLWEGFTLSPQAM